MSEKSPPRSEVPAHPLVWVAAGGLLVLATAAITSYAVTDDDQAQSGSPLYSFAVHEAIEGLRNTGAKEPAAQGEVCPDCGKIHPPAQHANPAQGVTPPVPPATPAAVPGGANLPLADYYYCEKCKAYHRREAAGAIPPAGPAPAATPAAPVPVTPQVPPSPPAE